MCRLDGSVLVCLPVLDFSYESQDGCIKGDDIPAEVCGE